MNDRRAQGTNVKKLIIRRMAHLAIPDGSGFADGIQFLQSPSRIASTAREATKWVFDAIDAVKSAPNCEWTTDEEIAGEILRQIEERVANFDRQSRQTR